MKEMDKEGLNTYQQIKQLKEVNSNQILMMQEFTQQYIDPKCKICKTCPAQIRFAWNRIINWANKMKIEELSFEEPQETKQTNTCECGNPTKDKRNKRCEDCKNK